MKTYKSLVMTNCTHINLHSRFSCIIASHLYVIYLKCEQTKIFKIEIYRQSSSTNLILDYNVLDWYLQQVNRRLDLD